MDFELNTNTALVTGRSEGIDKYIALALAHEGIDIAICARRIGLLEEAATLSLRRRAAGLDITLRLFFG